MTSKILFCFLLVTCCESALPPSFKKCDQKNEDFPQCFQTAVQDAIKQLTVPFQKVSLPSIDPLQIPSMAIKAGNGPVGFDQNYKNLKLYGWSKCEYSNIKMNFDAKTLNLDCFCPEIKGDFIYDFKGKLIVLPFSGKGPGTITMIKLNCSIVFYLEETEKNGNKHYKVKNTKYEMEPVTIHFHFDNLLGGDSGNTGAAISKNLNDIFNENWEVLWKDVKKQYEAVFQNVFGSLFNHFLSKVTVEELFDKK